MEFFIKFYSLITKNFLPSNKMYEILLKFLVVNNADTFCMYLCNKTSEIVNNVGRYTTFSHAVESVIIFIIKNRFPTTFHTDRFQLIFHGIT